MDAVTVVMFAVPTDNPNVITESQPFAAGMVRV
jgi:hypothetical protein